LKSAGFELDSVACKTGGIPKEYLGVKEDQKVHPGNYEAMCNPLCQAKILERAGTEFNILLGLCVGHDTLFIKYTNTPMTVLAVKDRALGHNPLAVLYGNYYFAQRMAALKKK
jgi:uncharacterized metal-binding protein